MTAVATYAGRYDGVYLISNDNPGEYGFGFCVSQNENYLGIQRHDEWEFSNIIVPLNEWHHASVVYQDGQFQLFWDGNLVLEKQLWSTGAQWNRLFLAWRLYCRTMGLAKIFQWCN